jgi:glycosyltransferase involved in cell wall biosynthesis
MAMETNSRPAIPDDCWVVVAAFNEGDRIGRVLDDLVGSVGNLVVVDDGSSDATVEVASERSAWVICHPVNLGQGAALQTGIDFALKNGARWIVTFDADGQHSVEDLPTVLMPLVSGEAEYTLGSRFLGRAPGIPWGRRAMLRLAAAFTWLLYGIRLTDAHNGFRGMTEKGASQICIEMNRMGHASEIVEQIARSGLPYVEVPVTVRYTPDTLLKGQHTSDSIRLGLSLILRRTLK